MSAVNEARKTIKLYTTAMDHLDLRSTVCVDYRAGQTVTERKLRLVEVLEEDLLEQRNLYESNLESVLTEHDWRCELQFGNIVAREQEQVA